MPEKALDSSRPADTDEGWRIFSEVEDLHPDFEDEEAIKSRSEVRDYTQTLKQDLAAWTPVYPPHIYLPF